MFELPGRGWRMTVSTQKDSFSSISVHHIGPNGTLKLEKILLIYVNLTHSINGFYRYRPGRPACIALNRRFERASDSEDLTHTISDLLNQRAEKLAEAESYLLFPMILVSNQGTLAAAKGDTSELADKLSLKRRNWQFNSVEGQSELLYEIRLLE
jgi:hypothetical protein